MANLNEEKTFENAIFRIETNTPVQGGAPSFDASGNPDGGYSNIQALQLANRTTYLKAVYDALGAVDKTAGAAYSGDMNTLLEGGWHEVSTNASNKPTSGKFTVLVVPGASDADVAQAAYKLSDGRGYIRVKSGGSWGAWKTLAQSGDLGTAASKDVGTNNDQVPQNSDLGSAAYEDMVLRGSVSAFATDTPPSGYLACNGAAVSRTTYSELFNLIGTTFGNGDGSTTFNLPDLRGEFIRGFDDGRGIDSSRVFGSFQADEFKSHKHEMGATNDPGTTGNFVQSGTSVKDRDALSSYTGGTETRPRNVALLYCIKY